MVNSSILVQSSELCVTFIIFYFNISTGCEGLVRDSLAQSILVSCVGMEQAKRHFSIDFSNFCAICWVFIPSECLFIVFFCTTLRLFCAIFFSRVFLLNSMKASIDSRNGLLQELISHKWSSPDDETRTPKRRTQCPQTASDEVENRRRQNQDRTGPDHESDHGSDQIGKIKIKTREKTIQQNQIVYKIILRLVTRPSLTAFTSFSRVLPTSRVVYCASKSIKRAVYCLNKDYF